MSAKKFVSALLLLCFVLCLSSASLAAPKKKATKKKAASGDSIAKILSRYKPENKTNAQTIHTALSKYKQNYILLVTQTEDNCLVFELLSAKNGAKKGKAVADFVSRKLINDPGSIWDKMSRASVVSYNAMGNIISFSTLNSHVETYSSIELTGLEELSGILGQDTFTNMDAPTSAERNTATFPFILQFHETGV